MDIEKVRLNMPLITSGGICGNVVAISKEGGLWLETEDRTRFPVHVECVRSTDESCTGCQKLEDFQIGQPVIFDDDRHGIIREFCEMGDIPTAVICFGDGGIAWRSLDRIKPHLTPLSEVAKCYKQVEPEDLFLSEDAKLVCEMLRANGPMTSHEISDRWCLSERVILEYLLEAKEAGIVRLDDGKYSIVRD